MSGIKEERTSLSNEELVVLSQQGDEIARSVLCERFLNSKGIHSSVPYLDSDDFVQESMLGFLKAVDTYDFLKGVPFEAYAFRCMQNKMKSAAVVPHNEVSLESQADYFDVPDTEKTPLDKLLDCERLSEVLTVCETTLTDVEKTVVFFRAGGMTYEEIGSKLGISSKTVDNALHRARRKLKNVCF